MDILDAIGVIEGTGRVVGFPDPPAIDEVFLTAGEGRTVWVAGHPYVWKATSATTGGRFTIMELPVAPQTGPPAHIHHWHDEIFYVLEGVFTFLVDERTVETGPGGYVQVPRGTAHRFRCISDAAGRLVSVFTPGGMEGYFDELSRLRLDQPVPQEFIDRMYEEYGLEYVKGQNYGPEDTGAVAKTAATVDAKGDR